MTDGWDRRSVLRAGVALGAIGLAGCLGDGDGDEEDGDGNATPPNGSDPGDSLPPNGTDPDGNTTDPENGTEGDGNSTNPDEGPDDDPEPDPEPVTSWPMHQRGARNTAAAPEAAAPTENVGELWRTSLGNSVSTSPVVADDTIYVLDLAGTVHAVSTDGDEQWTASVPEGELVGTPAIYGDLLLVPYETGVKAFDRTDGGTERWDYPVSPGTTDLAVADDAVFVSNTEFSVHAIEAASGERRWHHNPGNGYGSFHHAPAVHDGEVYIPKTRGTVNGIRQIAAVDVQSGDARIHTLTTDYLFTGPVSIAADGNVFAPTGDGIRAYDADGAERWHVPTERSFEAGLSVADGMVYGLTSGDHGSSRLYAVDVSNGEERWSVEADVGPGTGPVVVGDSVVYRDSLQIRAYDRITGEKRWRADAPFEWFGQCAFVDGSYYFAGGDGTLLAYGER